MARRTETASPSAGRLVAASYWAARRMWALNETAFSLARAAFNGLWLGLLGREALHRVDELYYDLHAEYRSTEHNLQGLLDWEERAIRSHFAGAGSILVLGAGGGREVIALRELGMEADGFECHSGLREAGSCLLAHRGAGELQPMERDVCPHLDRRYDGVIIGWSAYMLIQGRVRRVRLLEELRSAVAAGSPLLLSFFTRRSDSRSHRLTLAVARPLRRLLGRDPAELGDTLLPNFVHCFTREEVAGELEDAGWRMVAFSESPYPHAVAAAGQAPPSL